MKLVDEYRDPEAARRLAHRIEALATRPWTIMEICGGQTHAIVRFGIDRLIPDVIEIVHGPGCPVCVTPVASIDTAIELAGVAGVTLCSFGDMLRVPGSGTDLLAARAAGGDVRVVYSPMDALRMARAAPEREFVFFAVGFETTAPATAMAVHAAERLGVTNFSVLSAHVRVPPAMEAILSAPDNRIQGFLAAGHVCTIMGLAEYRPLARRYGVPIVATGFEPVDILAGLATCVRLLEEGRAEVENQYARVVSERGNERAQELVGEVFEPVDRPWRGLSVIPESGLGLRDRFRAFDAALRRPDAVASPVEDGECIAGEVLRGRARPMDCAAFGTRCTPERPLGAPMVSSEGACAAYHRYRFAHR